MSYALFLALSLLEGDVFLIDERTSKQEIEELAAFHQLGAMIDPCGKGEQIEIVDLTSGIPSSGRREVTIFTSGSTGRPKAVRHDWYSLTRPVRKTKPSIPQCWLLTYRPHLYGGLQVFMQCLVNQGSLAIPEPGMTVESLLELMRRSDVRSVSATPSYWRRLITLGSPADLSCLRLQQITVGGEIADQHLLDALTRLYPKARLVHLYAHQRARSMLHGHGWSSGISRPFLGWSFRRWDHAQDRGRRTSCSIGERHAWSRGDRGS